MKLLRTILAVLPYVLLLCCAQQSTAGNLLVKDTLRFSPTSVGSFSTKTEEAYLQNPNRDTLTILRAEIKGSDAADFTLPSSLDARAIQPFDTIPIVVNFKPTSAGNKVAFLQVTTTDSTYITWLVGEGVLGGLSVNVDTLDFGIVQLGTTNSKELLLSNVGFDSLEYSSHTIAAADGSTWGYSPKSLLPPFTVHTTTVQHFSEFAGTSLAILEIIYTSQFNNTQYKRNVVLRSYAFSDSESLFDIVADTIKAATRDTVSLRATIFVRDSMLLQSIDSIRYRIKVLQSVTYPIRTDLRGKVSDGYRVITSSIRRLELKTITQLPSALYLVTLGNTDAAPILIDSVRVFSRTGFQPKYTIRNGALLITDICENGGKELIENQTVTVQVHPNPTQDVLNITAQGTEVNNVDFKIYNTDGQTVAEGIITQNSLLLSHLPKGIYALRIAGTTSIFIKE